MPEVWLSLGPLALWGIGAPQRAAHRCSFVAHRAGLRFVRYLLPKPFAMQDVSERFAAFATFADVFGGVAKRQDSQEIEVVGYAEQRFEAVWSHEADPV